MKADTTKKP